MTRLKIENLHASINETQILKGLNLEIKKGEIHAIMGTNGSGKSTLSKVLTGHPAYTVNNGNILFENQNINKLSPEERDNVCRIIGKFAHTTKRRIQVDEFFAREFLDTLTKAGSQLPRDILENVIKFENAEKLNPPMEKRNKKILTKDLKQQVDNLEKEMQIREIPKISTQTDLNL